MGGLGSGNWFRWQEPKVTIEESLSVAVRDFRGRIYPWANGTLCWTSSHSGKKSSVGWQVTGREVLVLTLNYRWRDGEDVQVPVWLQTTPTQFGGKRWWFTCPLILNGVACRRRAGKLYLPPGCEILRLPQMPRVDLSKLPRGTSSRTTACQHGPHERVVRYAIKFVYGRFSESDV
jgi:hypothetical protein